MSFPDAARLSQPTRQECPAFCNNWLEMEGKNRCRESRPSSTALVIQGIHNKQKKNGFRRNTSSQGSQVYCYSCRTKETGRMDQVGECKRQSCHKGQP